MHNVRYVSKKAHQRNQPLIRCCFAGSESRTRNRTRYACAFRSPVDPHGDFLDGLRQIVRVMVAIGVEENFKQHSQITSCLPWICTSLHQPGRRGVSQRMRGYSGPKPYEPNGTLERRFDRGYRPSVVLDKMLRFDQSGASAADEQASGRGSGPSVAACWFSRCPVSDGSSGRALGVEAGIGCNFRLRTICHRRSSDL